MHITWYSQANYIDLYRQGGTKVMNIATPVPNPKATGMGGYHWKVPTSVQPGSNYYLVLELGGLNAVTVTSSDPKSATQQASTVKAAPIVPVTPIAPTNLK
jgi:hypothetical protein